MAWKMWNTNSKEKLTMYYLYSFLKGCRGLVNPWVINSKQFHCHGQERISGKKRPVCVCPSWYRYACIDALCCENSQSGRPRLARYTPVSSVEHYPPPSSCPLIDKIEGILRLLRWCGTSLGWGDHYPAQPRGAAILKQKQASGIGVAPPSAPLMSPL